MWIIIIIIITIIIIIIIIIIMLIPPLTFGAQDFSIETVPNLSQL